jgi:hypothetical protein
MTPPLTSLQETVIQRLRSSGHVALANEAHDAWARGAPLVAYQVGRAVGDSGLADDFARANTFSNVREAANES